MARAEITPEQLEAMGEAWMKVGQALLNTANRLRTSGPSRVELFWKLMAGPVFDRIEAATMRAVSDAESQIRAAELAARGANRGKKG